MERTIPRFFAVLVAGALALSACAGRLPKTKTSENTISKYFHHYGHKYKGTDFSVYKIEQVRVIDVQEIHKKLVAVLAEVRLLGGPTYMVRCVLEKKTVRWKLQSWERMS